jgi:hypothetical protein
MECKKASKLEAILKEFGFGKNQNLSEDTDSPWFLAYSSRCVYFFKNENPKQVGS